METEIKEDKRVERDEQIRKSKIADQLKVEENQQMAKEKRGRNSDKDGDGRGTITRNI